jgi:hypothetical protein
MPLWALALGFAVCAALAAGWARYFHGARALWWEAAVLGAVAIVLFISGIV